ncbi:MAG: hypothetical protein WAU45_16105 [Blastocatellia bacterium]
MLEADLVDLCEEMLYERAAQGIRPVLYVSSRKDFECSVLMLLGEPPVGRLVEQHPTPARGFRQHTMRS